MHAGRSTEGSHSFVPLVPFARVVVDTNEVSVGVYWLMTLTSKERRIGNVQELEVVIQDVMHSIYERGPIKYPDDVTGIMPLGFSSLEHIVFPTPNFATYPCFVCNSCVT